MWERDSWEVFCLDGLTVMGVGIKRRRCSVLRSTKKGLKKRPLWKRRRPGKRFFLCLMMSLTAGILLPGEVPTRQEIALWIGAEPTYSKEEVVLIIQDLMGIALEEIEEASLTTGREIAADEAGESAYYRALAEKRQEKIILLEAEIRKLRRRNWFFGGTALSLGGLYGLERAR